MPTEIERKYLVDLDVWEELDSDNFVEVRQAYLYSDAAKTVRVRTIGEEAFITIKGQTRGISRSEYEYPIPLTEAKEMISTLCSNEVVKVRHYIWNADKLWEVDVFGGENEGLIMAEIELESENDVFDLPDWVGREVTDDIRYSNAFLAKTPFCEW